MPDDTVKSLLNPKQGPSDEKREELKVINFPLETLDSIKNVGEVVNLYKIYTDVKEVLEAMNTEELISQKMEILNHVLVGGKALRKRLQRASSEPYIAKFGGFDIKVNFRELDSTDVNLQRLSAAMAIYNSFDLEEGQRIEGAMAQSINIPGGSVTGTLMSHLVAPGFGFIYKALVENFESIAGSQRTKTIKKAGFNGAFFACCIMLDWKRYCVETKTDMFLSEFFHRQMWRTVTNGTLSQLFRNYGIEGKAQVTFSSEDKKVFKSYLNRNVSASQGKAMQGRIDKFFAENGINMF